MLRALAPLQALFITKNSHYTELFVSVIHKLLLHGIRMSNFFPVTKNLADQMKMLRHFNYLERIAKDAC